MAHLSSVRVTPVWRRNLALIALGIVPAIIAWAIRDAHVHFPVLQGVLQNHADDFSGPVLATSILLLVASGLRALWRHWHKSTKEVRALTARLPLLAPVLATGTMLWVEFAQRTGGPFVIYSDPRGVWEAVSTFAGRHIDGVFDPWDVLTIVLAGVVCVVCIMTVGATATPAPAPATAAAPASASNSRRDRLWRLLVASLMVGAVMLGTTAAFGGEGGKLGASKSWPRPVVTISGNDEVSADAKADLPGGLPPGTDSGRLHLDWQYRSAGKGPWVTPANSYDDATLPEQTQAELHYLRPWKGEWRARAYVEFIKDGKVVGKSVSKGWAYLREPPPSEGDGG